MSKITQISLLVFSVCAVASAAEAPKAIVLPTPQSTAGQSAKPSELVPELKYFEPTPALKLAQAEDTPDIPAEPCCVFGTEEDYDPQYPASVPFGLVGYISPSLLITSMNCINPEEGLSANQWGERLGFSFSATGRGLFWYEGEMSNNECSYLPDEQYRRRPDIYFTGWTTNIPNPVVPGTYWIRGHFEAKKIEKTTNCDYSFGTKYTTVECHVRILPSEAGGLFTDTDRDGLFDYQEADYPALSDADPFTYDDGVLDSVRVKTNTAVTSADFDGDGLDGTQEFAKGSSTFCADSDRDGIPDDSDDYPLDPTRSSSGAGGYDITAPTVGISFPVQ